MTQNVPLAVCNKHGTQQLYTSPPRFKQGIIIAGKRYCNQPRIFFREITLLVCRVLKMLLCFAM